MAQKKGRDRNAIRKKTAGAIAEAVYGFCRGALDYCICIFLVAIIAVMPFYFEEGYGHIGTDKATFFRQCIIYGSRSLMPLAILTLVCWLVVWMKHGETNKYLGQSDCIVSGLKQNFSLTDCFACAYGLCIVISYFVSDYREEALWGTKGWFMGMIPQLSAVAIYFLVSRGWSCRLWMPMLVLPVSGVVFALGYLNRFDIRPIPMEYASHAFISTIGNINWYCGYVVSVFFGGLFAAWYVDFDKLWKSLLIQGYVLVGFATLMTQGSVSGVVALSGMLLVMFGRSVSQGRRMERFWLEMSLLAFTCVITCLLRLLKVLNNTYEDDIINLLTYSPFPFVLAAVSLGIWLWVHRCNQKDNYSVKLFACLRKVTIGGVTGALIMYVVLLIFNTLWGGQIINTANESLNNVFMFSPKWGSSRGATWMCGWGCFAEQDFWHKLFGIGPDCLSKFLYNDASQELMARVEAYFLGQRLTNAHNEWLTILINMGVVGIIGFAGMILSAIKRYIQSCEKSVIAGACGFCLLAYTINNMFSFQQSMSLATIFAVLGIGESYMRREVRNKAL